MRYRLACLAVLLVSLLALGACADPFFGIVGHSTTSAIPPAPATALSGSSWTLTQMSSDASDHSQPLVPTAPVTLQFQKDNATYFGSSGCNYYNGMYRLSGSQLHLDFKGVTLKACATAIMSQEVAYLNTLQRVTSYEVSGKSLTLKDVGGEAILEFMKA